MKISQQEKAKTRAKIVESAVKLVAEQGFRETTLRAIAQDAGIADATIYKYFTSKEDILYAFFDIRLEQVMARMQANEELHSYTFQEQFHSFLETQFELVENDRDFIKKAYKNIFLTNIAAAAEGMRGTRNKYKKIVNEMIDAAVDVGEFPEPPFKAYVLELLWEYSLAIGNYWLYDTSENFQNTTQVIDKSLGLIVAILSSDVLGKVADLFTFMIREHVLSLLDFNRKEQEFRSTEAGPGESSCQSGQYLQEIDMSKASSIPIGTFARTTVAGKTATRVGVKKIVQVAKRPFLSKEKYQDQRESHNQEIAREIFAGLSQLRGTALKIAQLFSMETDILPEALRRELSKSHYQVPPLNRAMIRRIIKAQFGKDPEQVFAHFEPEAFAAASLGQVHRARSFDGDDLAVKVQYPGIGRAVDNDIKLVKGIVSAFYKTSLVDRIFKEIAERLQEEVNYEREYQNTRYFYDHLPVDGILVPEPLESLCRKEVLVTRYIEGMHLREWLATQPAQETRNHYAQLLYEHYMRSLYQNNIIHSDPNPGNFLFCSDGKLGIIDYGCTKAYGADMINCFRKIVTSGMNQDETSIKEAYRGLCVEPMNDAEYEQAYYDYLKPLSDWLGKPYQSGRFDFKENPGYCTEGVRLMTESMRKNGFDKFTTETMFLDRYFYGIYRIFDEMGAEIHFNVDMVM